MGWVDNFLHHTIVCSGAVAGICHLANLPSLDKIKQFSISVALIGTAIYGARNSLTMKPVLPRQANIPPRNPNNYLGDRPFRRMPRPSAPQELNYPFSGDTLAAPALNLGRPLPSAPPAPFPPFAPLAPPVRYVAPMVNPGVLAAQPVIGPPGGPGVPLDSDTSPPPGAAPQAFALPVAEVVCVPSWGQQPSKNPLANFSRLGRFW